MSESNYLYMHNISKSFPGVKALSNVDLEVRQGEVLRFWEKMVQENQHY